MVSPLARLSDMDPRDSLLDSPHVRPLRDLIRAMRARGFNVPNVDPEDGGANAKAAFFLETPGPKCVASGYVSRENPDPSARNMGRALDATGFLRSEVVLWNVVPYCVSTLSENRNVTSAQIRASAPETQAFIDAFPNLAVVVFCGRSAQRARRFLDFPPAVTVLSTFHPGAQAYNHARCREHIHATFKAAHDLISGI